MKKSASATTQAAAVKTRSGLADWEDMFTGSAAHLLKEGIGVRTLMEEWAIWTGS